MLTSLRLQNFRSYKDESYEFGDKVNIVVGPNASGKTNLLEGILVAAQGRSYRAGDQELIQSGQDWARLETNSKDSSTRAVKIKLVGDTGSNKSFLIDDKPFTRLNLSRRLPVVLFEPNDLRLLSDEPKMRRDYLDNLLEQLNEGFGKTRADYRRSLAQRNRLLKGDPGHAHTNLFAWNVRLSELGGQIVSARQGLVNDINDQLESAYSKLANRPTKISIAYSSSLKIQNYADALLKKLQASTELDLARGFTGAGPHREDFVITINDLPAASVASRGEVRTIMLALKTIELKLIESLRNQKPLLLLDDVFSELDGKRRKALTKVLSSYQTFITTTDADIVIKHFTKKCNIILTSSANQG